MQLAAEHSRDARRRGRVAGVVDEARERAVRHELDAEQALHEVGQVLQAPRIGGRVARAEADRSDLCSDGARRQCRILLGRARGMLYCTQ
jgi:hypothetical protein